MRKQTPSSARTAKQTTLRRVITTAVNDLGMDVTVAVMDQVDGPLVSQMAKGFSDREVRTVLRTLSAGSAGQPDERLWNARDGAEPGIMRLRMVTPGFKTLLVKFLKDGHEVYGALVVGKPEGKVWAKREHTMIESAGRAITERVREAGLFDHSVILARPWVLQDPPARRGVPDDAHSTTPMQASPQVRDCVAACLTAARDLVPFDRGWVTLYDPVAAALEVLVCLAGHQKELLPGQRLSLNDSVSGWAVRHRKPRVDYNLASTQGRFHDYKQLYRDRFLCTLVAPFFVRGRVAGTITLASQTAARYDSAESASGALAPVMTRLAQCFEHSAPARSSASSPQAPAPEAAAPVSGLSEPAIRRQERQSALNEVGSFLATEIREPMGYIRAQLEEVTGDGALDADVKLRIESAMRDLVRTETLLNEILDFAKPLALDRRPCQVVPLMEEALALVEMDLKVNRIDVTKEFPEHLDPVRWDKDKVKHALLSILENALEAMSPEGKLRVSVAPKRGRLSEMALRIHNDGAPIPKELSEKIFEPYFTTKRSGTGLGLAMVKKIVEEHDGHIEIQSGPEEGTLVTITLPALRPRSSRRRRGGRSSRRRPAAPRE